MNNRKWSALLLWIAGLIISLAGFAPAGAGLVLVGWVIFLQGDDFKIINTRKGKK